MSHARTLRYGHFCRALAYWCYRADPDGSEAEADEVYNSRRFHLSDGLSGTKITEAFASVAKTASPTVS